MIVCTAILAAGLLYRYSVLLYRNWAWKKRTRMEIRTVKGALSLVVSLARSWKVRPGQYVYLTVARAGFFATLQRHPFIVTESTLPGSIELRIIPRHGFTKDLLELSLGEVPYYSSAWIEGPYGGRFDFREFGTVLMFASGVGILGHLPYMKDLIEQRNRFRIKTRDVLLIWYMERSEEHELVQSFMTSLLKRDKAKVDRSVGRSKTQDRPGKRPAATGENVST